MAAEICVGFPVPGVTGAPSGLERIEFTNDRGRVTVVFCRRHDAVFVVADVKDRDADRQRDGDLPVTGVSDRKGLRHRSGSCLGGGDHPRATGTRCVRPRAAITAQAQPERSHARVADPSRVDGVRPWAGSRFSTNGRGVVYAFLCATRKRCQRAPSIEALIGVQMLPSTTTGSQRCYIKAHGN